MLKTAMIAAGALIAIGATSLPAQAGSTGFSIGFSGAHGGIHFSSPGYRAPGYGTHHRHVVSPRAMTQRLRQQGFHRVQGLQRRGHVYTARAQRGWGRHVLVTADARTGRVLSLRRIR